MFFIFSMDFLLGVIGFIIVVVVFLMFPIPMLIILGLLVWAFVAGNKKQNELDMEGGKDV